MNSHETVIFSVPAFDASLNGLGISIAVPDAVNDIDAAVAISFKLVPLPLLTEDFQQTPIGARGWYASALLSAMMLISNCSGSRVTKNNTDVVDDNECKYECDSVPKGIDLLREDLKRACANEKKYNSNANNILLELGSGAIGLTGMTMAWIAAQYRLDTHNQQQPQHQKRQTYLKNKVVLTDYDCDCLAQLERNAIGVRQKLREYFYLSTGENINNMNNGYNRVDISTDIVPEIDVLRLDWNEHDQYQFPILPYSNSTSEQELKNNNLKGNRNNISFVSGAALVYTEATAVCADQVSKILQLHPDCVIWVVQWPRNGWFDVFRQQLLSSRRRIRCGIKEEDDNDREEKELNIDVKKFGPSSSPELFSSEIQQLALTLMPETMQQECRMDINELRAIRIINNKL